MIQPLTPREREVLRRAPCSNREIGVALSISQWTVRNHFRSISVKLRTWRPQYSGVRSRYASLLVAIRSGMIALDEVVMGARRRRFFEY